MFLHLGVKNKEMLNEIKDGSTYQHILILLPLIGIHFYVFYFNFTESQGQMTF